MTLHADKIIATCPSCGLKATVLRDRLPALLDRWRREHLRMAAKAG